MTTTTKQIPESVAHRSATISNLPSSYFHICFTGSNHPDGSIDLITIRTYLTAALQQFLGLTGTAIPIDILKTEGANVWLRVPSADKRAVHGALTQWVGVDKNMAWQVKAIGESLVTVSAASGQNLLFK